MNQAARPSLNEAAGASTTGASRNRHAAHVSSEATGQSTRRYVVSTSSAWTEARRSPAGDAVTPSTPNTSTSGTTTRTAPCTADLSASLATWQRQGAGSRVYDVSPRLLFALGFVVVFFATGLTDGPVQTALGFVSLGYVGLICLGLLTPRRR